MKKNYVYFDTCSLNKLAYIANYDFILKRLVEANYVLCISEINILEILRDTSDEYNIDKIIIMLQSFNKIIHILPSIKNIIESFINEKEKIFNIKFNNNVINEVINNKRLTFKVKNKKQLNNMKDFYIFFKKEIKNIPYCEDCDIHYCSKRIDNASFIFALILLSFKNLFIENIDIDKLWKRLKLNSINDVIKYININYEFLINNDRSPFRAMGKFAILQNSVTNGTFNDCIQSVYISLVDCIISDDKHFKNNIKNCLTFDEFMKSINIQIDYNIGQL